MKRSRKADPRLVLLALAALGAAALFGDRVPVLSDLARYLGEQVGLGGGGAESTGLDGPLQVVRVKDGDTLVLDIEGRDEDVRLIEELASRMGTAVDNAVRYQQQRETALMLQVSLLPSALPEVAGLRTTRTLEALEAAREAGLLSDDDARVLADGWRSVSRIRNAITLVRGKAADQLPRDTREKAAVSITVGYPPGGSDEMVNDYLRRTRRTHAVVDRIFWE